MMIDERRRTAAHGRQRTDRAAGARAFERVCPVETPPNIFQYLVEIGRRFRRCRHSHGEGSIKMRMAIDEPRHQHCAVAVDDFIALCSDSVFAYRDDSATVLAEVARLNRRWVELYESRVFEVSCHFFIS